MTEAEIHALFSALQNGTDGMKALARQQLREAGDAVMEPLQQALEDLLWTHLPHPQEPASDPLPLTPEQRQRVLSMALVLSDFGSPWSLRTLAKAGFRAPFLSTIAALEARADPEGHSCLDLHLELATRKKRGDRSCHSSCGSANTYREKTPQAPLRASGSPSFSA